MHLPRDFPRIFSASCPAMCRVTSCTAAGQPKGPAHGHQQPSELASHRHYTTITRRRSSGTRRGTGARDEPPARPRSRLAHRPGPPNGYSGSGSPPMMPSPHSPGRARRRGSPASASRRRSGGRAARNSAQPPWTSPTAAAWPTLGAKDGRGDQVTKLAGPALSRLRKMTLLTRTKIRKSTNAMPSRTRPNVAMTPPRPKP
jgi:hypothetical protein